MQILNIQSQRILAIVLFVLLAMTRSSHLGSVASLPDASWAVFFVAGVYLHHRGVFAGLLALGLLIDWFSTSVNGVSAYCLSPAYAMMLPTYASIWAVGRFYAKRPRLFGHGVLTGLVMMSVATVVAELISSGSFYLLNASVTGFFLSQEISYFPGVWVTTLGYVGALGLVVKALPEVTERLFNLASVER